MKMKEIGLIEGGGGIPYAPSPQMADAWFKENIMGPVEKLISIHKKARPQIPNRLFSHLLQKCCGGF